MSERTPIDALNDIRTSAEKARSFVEGMTYENFVQDDKAVFAVIRALEVVGEATKRFPQSLREEHPDVPWALMAGMRDKLIHDYVNVDRRIVWRTVQEELPGLQRQVRMILQELDP